MLKNAIARAVDSQMSPLVEDLVAKRSTTEGQLDILKNAIEKAVDSQMYPPVEAYSGQEHYYICLLISCLAIVEVSHTLEYV